MVPTLSRRLIGLLFSGLFIVSLTACNPCSNSVKSTAVSPDGQLAARVSERDCGATTDFSSVVNLQRASDKFDPKDGVLFIAKGQHAVSSRWTGDKQLLLTCLSCSRKDISRQTTAFGDIDIHYAAE